MPAHDTVKGTQCCNQEVEEVLGSRHVLPIERNKNIKRTEELSTKLGNAKCFGNSVTSVQHVNQQSTITNQISHGLDIVDSRRKCTIVVYFSLMKTDEKQDSPKF